MSQPRPRLVGDPPVPGPGGVGTKSPAEPAAHKATSHWLTQVFKRSSAEPEPVETAAPDLAESLLGFPSEAALAPSSSAVGKSGVVTKRAEVAPRVRPAIRLTWQRPSRRVMIAGGVVCALALFLLVPQLRRAPLRMTEWMRAPEVRPGTLSIDTRPTGAEITIDGQLRGLTPLTVSLAQGAHQIVVRRGADERVVPLTMSSGGQVAQYFDLKAPEPAAPVAGRIFVATDPAGAKVVVDGQARGVSPVTIADLSVAEHRINVTGATGSADRVVTVEAGGTTSVVFSLPKVSAPVAGWLTVNSPFEVQVLERDEIVGTSGSAKIMLAAGPHEIVLVNRNLSYQETRKIDLPAGKVAAIRVDPPKASVSANARPWADVTVDGTAVGQTPLANLTMTIGTHQVVFRHPQYGERRQTIVVTAKGPNRIAVDFTKAN
jgi:PEGA domain-containing protein